MTALPDEHEGRYVCPVCARRFWLLAEKKSHVRLKHPKQVKA